MNVYGMIHQAAELMVIDRFGEEKWRAICNSAGLTAEFFIGFEYYPDERTMDLIKTIADQLDLTEDTVLFDFGEYWVKYAKSSAYGRAIGMAGDDLHSFFQNLDRMHAAIKSNLPKADMPSFVVRGKLNNGFEVHYRSSRDGLQPFVHGLITAIAHSFGEAVEVTYDRFTCGATFRIRRFGAIDYARQ